MTESVDWYGPDAATFGDRIAAAREHAGLSQAQLARRLGVRVDTVRAWEDDRSEPRANRLSMMAGLLSVSMMWLLNGEGDGLPAPGEEEEMPTDLKEALDELRAVKAALSSSNARLGRVEKRLRNLRVVPE
ncbi:helix-turn-helix domain-containing protein [Aquicoccus sp. SCR17]|nr:helix-turn-helix domain-containing protein [Carideicomes alvinocaridis]